MVNDDLSADHDPEVDSKSTADPTDDRPLVAEDVVMAYAADAVLAIPGIAGLHGSPWQSFSGRVRPDHTPKGVVVRTVAPGVIEVDVHVRVAWGTAIPEVARQVRDVITRKMEALLDLEVRKATLYVDEIDAPSELA